MNWLVEFISPISRALAEHMINGLILSAAIYSGFLIIRLLFFNHRRGSAATSHRVLSLVFVALAFTPIVTRLQPAQGEMDAPVSQPSTVAVTVSSPPEPSILGDQIQETPELSILDGQIQETLFGESEPGSPLPFSWTEAVNWPMLVAAAWAASTCVLLIRLFLALKSLWILHRRVRILQLPENLTSRRQIQLAESALVHAPVAVGLWAPKVLLPSAPVEQLSADDWNRVLRHEIAHLERYDDWSNFFQRVLIAFNPFNPFLWLIGNELRLVREIVCDDWVVAESSHAKSYAQLLTRLAVISPGSLALASGVSRSGRQLYRRIARILDTKCNRKLKPSWVTTTLAGAGLLTAAVAGICWLPAVTWASEVQAEAVNPSPDAGPSSPEGTDVPPDHGQLDKKQAVDPEIIALLKNSALNDSDPRVREQAVASLVTIENDQATDALLQLLDDSKEDRTKVFILRTLNHRRSADSRIREKLSEFAARNQSLPVRLAALDQLAKNADAGAVDQFIAIYRSASEQPIKGSCLRGLARIGSKPARDFLIATAKNDPDPDSRRVALRVLVGPPERGRGIFIRRDRVMPDGMELEMPDEQLNGLHLPPEGLGEPELLMMPDNQVPATKSGLPKPQFSPSTAPLPPLPNGPELQLQQPNG